MKAIPFMKFEKTTIQNDDGEMVHMTMVSDMKDQAHNLGFYNELDDGSFLAMNYDADMGCVCSNEQDAIMFSAYGVQ